MNKIILVMSVDGIVITENDMKGIDSLKKYLQQTKDLGSLKYFLDIEVARFKKGILLSQRKYVFELLLEAKMLKCRSIDSSMDVNIKLSLDQGSFLRMLRDTRD